MYKFGIFYKNAITIFLTYRDVLKILSNSFFIQCVS
jgi:hypothetical protein